VKIENHSLILNSIDDKKQNVIIFLRKKSVLAKKTSQLEVSSLYNNCFLYLIESVILNRFQIATSFRFQLKFHPQNCRNNKNWFSCLRQSLVPAIFRFVQIRKYKKPNFRISMTDSLIIEDDQLNNIPIQNEFPFSSTLFIALFGLPHHLEAFQFISGANYSSTSIFGPYLLTPTSQAICEQVNNYEILNLCENEYWFGDGSTNMNNVNNINIHDLYGNNDVDNNDMIYRITNSTTTGSFLTASQHHIYSDLIFPQADKQQLNNLTAKLLNNPTTSTTTTPRRSSQQQQQQPFQPLTPNNLNHYNSLNNPNNNNEFTPLTSIRPSTPSYYSGLPASPFRTKRTNSFSRPISTTTTATASPSNFSHQHPNHFKSIPTPSRYLP
jgi:hypothetical protein